jgi:hypothetical protein
MADELADVLEREIGVSEQPPGSNDGVRVREYLRSAGILDAEPWCSAFVHWGCEQIGKPGFGAWTPSWNQSSLEIDKPERSAWGLVWFPKLDRYGHIFVVTKVFENGMIETVEGNTNIDGSREGTGVFKRIRTTQAHRYFKHR